MKDNKYTVAIIDDETFCIKNIRRSVDEFPELLIVGTAQTSDDGKRLILEQQPDLLFLDVEMPGQTGLELLTELHGPCRWFFIRLTRNICWRLCAFRLLIIC